MKQQKFDASRFSDSLAPQTAWDSLGKAGAANRGHRPVLVNRFSYSYLTQELNLVLKDGKREHVVDATSLDQIRKDAQTLGMFLEKPVWDATAF